jgi:hypothetical protein
MMFVELTQWRRRPRACRRLYLPPAPMLQTDFPRR